MKLIDNKIQKVALVNPNFITKSITDKFTIPALGLEYLAANILDLVKVKIIDGKVRNLNLKEIMKEINEFRFRIRALTKNDDTSAEQITNRKEKKQRVKSLKNEIRAINSVESILKCFNN